MQKDRRAADRREANDRQALFAQVPSVGAAREDLRREELAADALRERVPHALRQTLWLGARRIRAALNNYSTYTSEIERIEVAYQIRRAGESESTRGTGTGGGLDDRVGVSFGEAQVLHFVADAGADPFAPVLHHRVELLLAY